ncbi:DUF11 domain-containing protein [Streptomyces uncialis]|uniref:DUF11 domain-containing protein n=1 Tax=Streptomyces uncialis TaxID=1048205 RepID=UPI00093DDADF|nr:DUF11 domain-containing protein [Streptomyces uncialis]
MAGGPGAGHRVIAQDGPDVRNAPAPAPAPTYADSTAPAPGATPTPDARPAPSRSGAPTTSAPAAPPTPTPAPPTLTPTPTATATPTPTAPASPTAPPTGTATPTPSGTPSETALGTPESGAPGPGPAPARADLALSSEFVPRTATHRLAAEGDGLTHTYRLTAINHGPARAVDVVVTDELPAALEYVSGPRDCAARGRTVTCGPLAALRAGESYSWLITVRLSPGYTGDGSDITNIAAVSSGTPDPDHGNNQVSLGGLGGVPPGVGIADLSLGKTAVLPEGRSWVVPGDTFTYRVEVRNQGPGTARDVKVTDPLPRVLSFVSSPDGCAVSGPTRQLVTCPSLERLPAGEHAVYRIVVRVLDETTLRGGSGGGGHGGHQHQGCEIENLATVTSSTRDPDPADNTNPPGTTGPGGGPLYLKHPGGKPSPHPTRPPTPRPTPHPTRPGDGHGPGHGHDHGHGKPGGGRPHLADSGREVPGWLPWSAGAALTTGGLLVFLARRRDGS